MIVKFFKYTFLTLVLCLKDMTTNLIGTVLFFSTICFAIIGNYLYSLISVFLLFVIFYLGDEFGYMMKKWTGWIKKSEDEDDKGN